MRSVDNILLISIFVCPDLVKTLSLADWDLLVRQARAAGVLARLGVLLKQKHLTDTIPQKPASHLKSAMIYAECFAFSLRQEIKIIRSTLQKCGIPLILLKGGAYIWAKNKAGKGRVFSDIDVLISKEQLADAEGALLRAGWFYEKKDKYDREYYRKWMHELPPMRHLKRGTSLDVHHNILPLTARNCPDAEILLLNIVEETDDIWVLATVDRVLHSAIHLFYGGEFDHGFRDLSDLDLLLREFCRDENFWHALIDRAGELRQIDALFYALRYTHSILRTPVPESVFKRTEFSFSAIKMRIMDFLFSRALMPDHPSCCDLWTGPARWLLYIRSHCLRMPLYLLLPHLLRKSWMRLSSKRDNKNK